jgi:hypothetical protein
MSNEKIGRINNELSSPKGQNTLEPKEKVVGRVNNKSASPTSQNTSEPKEKIVGRVNNESDKNSGSKTAIHDEESGVVNNEKNPFCMIRKHKLLRRRSPTVFLTS